MSDTQSNDSSLVNDGEPESTSTTLVLSADQPVPEIDQTDTTEFVFEDMTPRATSYLMSLLGTLPAITVGQTTIGEAIGSVEMPNKQKCTTGKQALSTLGSRISRGRRDARIESHDIASALPPSRRQRDLLKTLLVELTETNVPSTHPVVVKANELRVNFDASQANYSRIIDMIFDNFSEVLPTREEREEQTNEVGEVEASTAGDEPF